MGKLPAFQFYPADWLNDLKLQTCDMAAQGLLINLMCLMHQSEKYGYLLINGSRPDHKTIIKLLRTHHRTFINSVNKLLLCGALKQTEDGIYYCERMVKDEYIRNVRRKAGLKGGNPNLEKGKPNPYYLDKQKDKQKITPSSSSSSSSSLKQSEQAPSHFQFKVSDLLDNILKQCETIKKLKQKNGIFNPYMWVQTQTNISGHPQAILDSLKGLISFWKTVKNPWTYANSIMKTKSQNYNEKDFIKQQKQFKKEFNIDPRIKKLLDPIGDK